MYRRKQNAKSRKIAAKFFKRGGSFNLFEQQADLRYMDIGRNVSIGFGAEIQILDNYNGQVLYPRLILEDEVSIQPRFCALVQDTLLIKRGALIARNCSIITNNHGMDAESPLLYGLQPLTTAPVTIGEECWIGQNVTILSGVEIGKRCIIAAGSVVTKSIPAYTIAAGIPAKVIKKWNFDSHAWENYNQ